MDFIRRLHFFQERNKRGHIQVICRIKGMKHLFTPLGKSILGFIYSLKELQQLFFFFYFLILPVRHTYRFTETGVVFIFIC